MQGSDMGWAGEARSAVTKILPVFRIASWLLLGVCALFWILLVGRSVAAYLDGGGMVVFDFLRENARAFAPRVLPIWEVALRYSGWALVTILACVGVRCTSSKKREQRA
jgi:hypothetical protein